MKAEEVRPRDIDAMIQAIVKRGAPTIANDVLRWIKRIFDFGIKRQIIQINPASAFNPSDTGGKEEARDRWLTREEITQLFQAMRDKAGSFTIENVHAVRLLLLLAVWKEELIAAQWGEFDLDRSVWHLAEARTKTNVSIDIPLSAAAVVTLRERDPLRFACPEDAKPDDPAHRHEHPECSPGEVHQAPNGGRLHYSQLQAHGTHHLAALGVDAHIAERCMNHKLKGVEGVYNRHNYNVVPLVKKRSSK